MSKDASQTMKTPKHRSFSKRTAFLASSYLIDPDNERTVKFLYKLFAKCFTEDKS